MVTSDPARLDALARSLEAYAEEVRDRCRTFGNQVGAVAWQSETATEYRAHCDEVRRGVAVDAQRLDEAAATMRAHADAVRERIAWMHRMVDQMRAEAEEAYDATQGGFEWGREQADEAWETVKGWL